MSRVSPPLQAMLLALLLVLTGQSMAQVRMAPGIGGEMVLCTGTGPITVVTDENGDPVGPPHVCPECAMSLFAAVPVAPAQPGSPAGEVRKRRWPWRASDMVQAAVPAASARDPPAWS